MTYLVNGSSVYTWNVTADEEKTIEKSHSCDSVRSVTSHVSVLK